MLMITKKKSQQNKIFFIYIFDIKPKKRQFTVEHFAVNEK